MSATESNGRQRNHSLASLLARRDITFGEQMNKLAISLAVGAGALFATAASAAPLSSHTMRTFWMLLSDATASSESGAAVAGVNAMNAALSFAIPMTTLR